MVARVKAAVPGKIDSQFVIMARSQALGVEWIDADIDLAKFYHAAVADMILANALTTLAQ
jgi:methylisocitrate lyase